MDHQAIIQKIYDQLEDDRVDNAAMACLRLARGMKDYIHAAIFLFELYPEGKEMMRMLSNDISHLKQDAQIFIFEHAQERWVDTRSYSNGDSDELADGDQILTLSALEFDVALEALRGAIDDQAVPPGMGEYDTAAFTDENRQRKMKYRARMRTVQEVKQKVKTRCLNYAIYVENQIKAQSNNEHFLLDVQTRVNNYFRTRSEDVYSKLMKSSQLSVSDDVEDRSLLLTEVRRSIKAFADYFYPPKLGQQECADGVKRNLGDEAYMNRIQEFLITAFENSSSKELLISELNYFVAFARRLNSIASKGVHATVTGTEAKQGLLGLYLLAFNVINHLTEAET